MTGLIANSLETDLITKGSDKMQEFERILQQEDRQFLFVQQLPDHDSFLKVIRSLVPTTGILDNLFCNGFMSESVELIKHALFLYEDGYFDCAFYSLRQSVEIVNSMLLCASDGEKLQQWRTKAWFPMDNKVKGLLEKHNSAYNEIKEAIPTFFDRYNQLLFIANKYIHKQGFDTFYIYRVRETDVERTKRTNIFLELMKYAIGMILIMNIALDPLSLILTDQDVDTHIHFDPLTEPIPVAVFAEFLSLDFIESIKETEFYKTTKNYFLSQEQLNDAVYLVIRYQHFDISRLKDIESQVHLLDLQQALILCILKAGIKASHFYSQEDTIIGYSTSIEPKKYLMEHSSRQFDEYLHTDCSQNIAWNDMFISIFELFDSRMIIQHNEEFDNKEIDTIKGLISFANQCYRELMERADEKKHKEKGKTNGELGYRVK